MRVGKGAVLAGSEPLPPYSLTLLNGMNKNNSLSSSSMHSSQWTSRVLRTLPRLSPAQGRKSVNRYGRTRRLNCE